MTALAFLKVAVFFLLVLAVTKPLGLYLRRVFSGERTFLDPVLGPVERLVYRLGGIDSVTGEQHRHELDGKESGKPGKNGIPDHRLSLKQHRTSQRNQKQRQRDRTNGLRKANTE